jgi:hypothetical protein
MLFVESINHQSVSIIATKNSAWPRTGKKVGEALAFERWRLTAARQPATMPSMNFSYPHPVLTWWRR